MGKGFSGFQKLVSRRRTGIGTTKKTRLRSMMRKGIELLLRCISPPIHATGDALEQLEAHNNIGGRRNLTSNISLMLKSVVFPCPSSLVSQLPAHPSTPRTMHLK